MGFIITFFLAIIPTFFGGWVAAYLGRNHDFSFIRGILYGFSMWCLGLFILIIFSSKMGEFVQNQINSLYDTSPAVSKKNTESNNLASEKNKTVNASLKESIIETESSKISPLFLVFIFLFIGGMSSCLGGYYGTSYKKIRGQSFSNCR